MTPPPADRTPPAPLVGRRRLRVTGTVQGVGFRPHVHRLATELDLVGFVGNDEAGVFIEVQGTAEALDVFTARLVDDAPPLAEIVSLDTQPVPPGEEEGFRIVASTGGQAVGKTVGAPPDTATCRNCLAELADPTDRRHRHPFITCTDCGPRFTIITRLPYDRPATTMRDFPMCAACASEYEAPSDRRFHAQPVACHDCGPTLRFEHEGSRRDGRGPAAVDAALAAAQRALADGGIVAIKGIGGYHLACRADDETAVNELRRRKHRPGKPLALLVADLEGARRLARVTDEEATVLTSPAAPIVLLQRRTDPDGVARVAPAVAPDNPLLGIMLASNPLHLLVLSPVPGSDVDPLPAIVLTSGNLSQEPICTDDDEARERLADIADAWLWHDRPIAVPCDDSVVRVLADGPSMVRRSRGYVPTPVPLPTPGRPALALGGELKATVCLTDGQRAWLSQHLGDMGGLETLRAFEQTVERTKTMYEVRPEVYACDAHPEYTTHRWARREGRTPLLVQHHHAHVAACMAEHGLTGPVIGVAFDGTGYGPDDTIWGGEVLRADHHGYTRIAHLSTALLPGGDAAIRHPRRVALSHLRTAGVEWAEDLAPVRVTPADERGVLAAQLDRQLNTVLTSSMGRLFDAVASLLDVRHDITYEAQAAIELEILATRTRDAGTEPAPVELPLTGSTANRPDDPVELDCAHLVEEIVASLRANAAVGALALGFHHAVADAVHLVAERERATTGIDTVCLSGGVFGNALLTELVTSRLEAAGLTCVRHRRIPPNDGGLSLGQAVIASVADRNPLPETC